MSDETPEPKPKRRLTVVEDLSEQVNRLEATNAGLVGTVDELHAALLELVGAPGEAGAQAITSKRWERALGARWTRRRA